MTNACNIRCKGCWFFENEFEKKTRENKSLEKLEEFVLKEKARGINNSILIGGEPSLFLKRIEKYVEHMEYVTLSTNGLVKIPVQGLENVQVFISLFGGGPLDDELRAIKPTGAKFKGLFEKSLGHYKNDNRATYVYAITERGIDYIEDTVRKIENNGNNVTFNFYSQYDESDPLYINNLNHIKEELLRVQEKYSETVLSTPYYIDAMLTGKSHWGSFSYDTCPSLSVDNPEHKARLVNGNRVLPLFNTYAPDLKTVLFCCTSGNCEDCRDSQAVYSWLLVSVKEFMDSNEHMRDWVELAESYWKQHVWSPFCDSRFIPVQAVS